MGGQVLVAGRPAAVTGGEALPWEWFDFEEGARAAPMGGIGAVPTVEEGGWRRVWKNVVDGRGVAFKVFRRAGAGGKCRPVLVLLHGMGLTIATFRGVAAYLLETHDLVLVDYSSLSVADGANGERVAIKAYVRSVFSILEALGVDRFSVAGNSLGGGLSLIVAIEGRGRVEKVLLSNPACFPQTLPRTYRLARVPLVGELLMLISAPEKLVGGVEYIGYVDKGRFERELRRRYEENFASRANRFKLMRIMRELPAEARDVTVAPHLLRLGEIDAEVLLTWGDQDPLLVEGAGERLARSLRRVTFERHADLAHMPHEEAPERVGRRWAAFLNEENC